MERADRCEEPKRSAAETAQARFSVLIPAYQAAATVGRAVSSVLEQTLPAHQVIVCDDGSTDGILDVLAPYAAHIDIVRQENRGLSAARNRALAEATGDWVVLLDADDEFLPTRLERMAERMGQQPDVDIVTTDAFVRSPQKPDVRYYDLHAWPDGDQVENIVRGSFIFVAAAIRRARLVEVGGFREGLAHDSEYATWVDLVLSGSRATLVDEPLAIYHQSGGSQLSADRAGTYRMVLEILDGVEGTRDEVFDSIVSERRSEVQRLLSVAEGVRAVRSHDRRRILRSAMDRRLSFKLRTSFVGAALVPRAAAKRLGS